MLGDMGDLDHQPTRQGTKAKTMKHRPASGVANRNSSAKKKTTPLSKFNADDTDKIFDLEKENMTLKQKENLLEMEIVKMKTKLHRIDELMRKKSKYAPDALKTMPEDI